MLETEKKSPITMNGALLEKLNRGLSDGILQRWYPLVIDGQFGGYLTNVTFDWKLPAQQEKMIVSQARHIWTLSKAAEFFGDSRGYKEMALHGFVYLRDVMWDGRYGGFHQILDCDGGPSDVKGWREEKRTYGNAFGVYALAALFGLTGNPEVLDLARRAFSWIEDHAFDPVGMGYFQFLTREGTPFDRTSEYTTIADDGNELGFKDQNSSIHLLEAYTELYRVWKDDRLRERLSGILTLIRDTMVGPEGYLRLFFQPDWRPVSFRNAPPEIRELNYGLDHVSFGHDYETAFLMLEASHVLGLADDTRTLTVARGMLDHAMAWGWDTGVGGFYDGGYYFAGEERCSIVRDTKNWWAQAEGLNALLLFSLICPDDPRYGEYFLKQWKYIDRFILDHERGDWFEGGLDKEPHLKTGPKSHIWKCTYHTGRSLMNCIALLSGPEESRPGIMARKRALEDLIAHFRH